MPSNVDLTNLNNALNELIPVNESEIFNSMLSDFRGRYFETTGQDFEGLNQNNINYIEMLVFSSRLFDAYFTIRFVISALLLPYATNQYLDVWAQVKGLSRKEDSQASGNITFPTTTTGVVLPVTTILINNEGLEYTTVNESTSQGYTYTVTSVTQINNIIRYVLDLPQNESDHGMYSGQVVTLSGSQNVDYNGDKPITVINSTTIEFEVPFAQLPDTDPSVLRVTYTGLKVSVISKDFTTDANMSANETLTLQNAISGLNQSARVQFTGITGGGSTETETEFQNRVFPRFKKVYTRYNENDVFEQLKELNTSLERYKVRRAHPNPNQATIHVGKASTTQSEAEFSTSELSVFEDHLNNQEILGLLPDGIDVINFVPINIDISISNVTPNNSDLTQAIQTNIENYFLNLDDGEEVSVDELKGIIVSATTFTGVKTTDFTLTTPVSDTQLNQYEVAYINNLTITTA